MTEIRSLNQKSAEQETSPNPTEIEVDKPGNQFRLPLEIETNEKSITELFQTNYSINDLVKPVQSESGDLRFTSLTSDTSNTIRLTASTEGVKAMLPEVPISDPKDNTERSESNVIELSPIAKLGDSTNPYQEALLEGAEKHLGTKPWEKSRYKDHLGDGKIAGGASVVEVLKSMGVNIDGANPARIVARLIAQGWTMHGIKQAKPGDVVFGGQHDTNWQEGSGNADMGIVGEQDNAIYQVDKSSGKWNKGSLESLFPKGKYGEMIWVLRPLPIYLLVNHQAISLIVDHLAMI